MRLHYIYALAAHDIYVLSAPPCQCCSAQPQNGLGLNLSLEAAALLYSVLRDTPAGQLTSASVPALLRQWERVTSPRIVRAARENIEAYELSKVSQSLAWICCS